jgi:hypothetical protein
MSTCDPDIDAMKCLFCRMPTPHRFDPSCGLPGFKEGLAVAGLMGGVTFVLEEVLLFTVLVFVKHRLPPRWQT